MARTTSHHEGVMELVKVLKLSNDKRFKHGKVYRLKEGMPARDKLEKLGYELICVDHVSIAFMNWSDGSVVTSSMHKGTFVMDSVANSHYRMY